MSRCSWHLWARGYDPQGDDPQATIEAYELTGRCIIECRDGRHPANNIEWPPIGADLDALADALAELLNGKEAGAVEAETEPKPRHNARGAYSIEGERKIVRQYWQDKAAGMFDEAYWDESERSRKTQEDWAKNHGISERTLRRYLDKHPDLAPPP